jgi:hypothetical protein
LTDDAKVALVPKLLIGLRDRPEAMQARLIALLVLPVLGLLKPPQGAAGLAALGLDHPGIVAVVLSITLDLFKLVNASSQPAKPIEAGSTLLPPPPAGLSRNQLYRIVGKDGVTLPLNSTDKVVAAKLGALEFLTEHQLFEKEILAHLFVAQGDGHHTVARSSGSWDSVLCSRMLLDPGPVGLKPAYA